MKNRNIHSKVISVKLFCREKVLRMYCTFILICWVFANKILCLRPHYFSNVFVLHFSWYLLTCFVVSTAAANGSNYSLQ